MAPNANQLRLAKLLTPDNQRELRDSEKTQIPPHIEAAIKRGQSRNSDIAPLRNECLEMWRGNQYVSRAKSGQIAYKDTVSGPGSNKPSWRVRRSENLLIDPVEAEVAAATQRVPNYEITASTTDPEDASAARLSERIARYGYDKWSVRKVIEQVVTFAVVADSGFAMPYFDNTIGPSIDGQVGVGELVVRVFGPNEVFWEPGIRFDDSRWHCIQQARPLSEIYAMKGYKGGKLTPDAVNAAGGGEKAKKATDLALVTEYFERPSMRNAKGIRLVIANGHVITEPEGYPLCDPKGEPVDEPCLHKISYITDPDSDQDMGLVRFCLDAQRRFNDCGNKIEEWKNMALVPQILAPVGSFNGLPPYTDEPGKVIEYNPTSGQPPQWRPVPQIPRELFEIQTRAKEYIGNIFAQNDIPGNIEAGKAIQALLEKDASRRARFIVSLAEFHSRLMRHCLWLVQRHYSEPRLLKIRGRYGVEPLSAFMGAQLRGQADVVVQPGSLEPRTKAAMTTQIMTYAQMGWISPEKAMASINGGTGEALIQSYELDIAGANRVIEKIRIAGPANPQVPMPRPFDNLDIHESILTDWMKTDDYALAPAHTQQVADLYYEGLQALKAQADAQKAQQMANTAAAQGMGNAAKQVVPQMPSLPADPSQPPA